MAAKDNITPISGYDRPFDGLCELVDCYEALQLLAMQEDGHSAPVPCLLANLNLQLRAFLDEADVRGLVS